MIRVLVAMWLHCNHNAGVFARQVRQQANHPAPRRGPVFTVAATVTPGVEGSQAKGTAGTCLPQAGLAGWAAGWRRREIADAKKRAPAWDRDSDLVIPLVERENGEDL